MYVIVDFCIIDKIFANSDKQESDVEESLKQLD